jgi:hypothetical protein
MTCELCGFVQPKLGHSGNNQFIPRQIQTSALIFNDGGRACPLCGSVRGQRAKRLYQELACHVGNCSDNSLLSNHCPPRCPVLNSWGIMLKALGLLKRRAPISIVAPLQQRVDPTLRSTDRLSGLSLGRAEVCRLGEKFGGVTKLDLAGRDCAPRFVVKLIEARAHVLCPPLLTRDGSEYLSKDCAELVQIQRMVLDIAVLEISIFTRLKCGGPA